MNHLNSVRVASADRNVAIDFVISADGLEIRTMQVSASGIDTILLNLPIEELTQLHLWMMEGITKLRAQIQTVDDLKTCDPDAAVR